MEVTGRVLVDGEPPDSSVQVAAHPVSVDKEHPTVSKCGTDTDGRFTFNTYRKGDGLPAEEYKLTFMWGQANLVSATYGGPDKLGGKYSDPETSEFTVTVVDGEGQDLGDLELTSAEQQTSTPDDRR